jgi:hypothetical protein
MLIEKQSNKKKVIMMGLTKTMFVIILKDYYNFIKKKILNGI